MSCWFIMWKLGLGALALRQVFHAWLMLSGSEGEGELPLFQAKEQMHVSVQPAGAAHTQQKHMCTQAHAGTPSQVHAVQTSPSCLLSHSPLDNSFLAHAFSQPILCWHPTCWQLVRRCISSLEHLWGIMDGPPRHWGSVAMVG